MHTQVETPIRPDQAEWAQVVARDIKQVLGPRLAHASRSGLAFLLSMGMLVKDPSERQALLREALPYALSVFDVYSHRRSVR